MEFGDWNIRLIGKRDASLFFRLVEDNRDRLVKYFPLTTKSVTSHFTARKYVKRMIQHAKKDQSFNYLIEHKRTQQVVGSLMIKNIDWYIPKCELAYFVDRRFAGMGITSRGIQQIVRHCFGIMKMNKIFIRIGTENIPSKRIAEKNGFQLEGVLKKEFKTYKGELIDVEYYGLTKQNKVKKNSVCPGDYL